MFFLKSKWSIFLSVVLLVATLSGCGGSQQSAEYTLPKGEVSYPIKTDVKLTYWMPLNTAIGTQVKNFGETPFAKELEKRTGIKVEYRHPAQGQEKEAINILLASDELPDIIQTDWLLNSPEKMIKNKIILKLNDIFEGYSPNLSSWISKNPDIANSFKTDEGSYYAFPFIRGDELLLTSGGFMVRGDSLKELGVSIPETIEEWDAMLEKLKTKFESPIACTLAMLNYLSGGFGTYQDFYVENGNVKYSPIEPEYKAFLAKLAEWYKKGYIDPNFATLDTKIINSNMLDGKSAVTFGGGGGTLGALINSGVKKDPKYSLEGIAYPATKKGEKAKFGLRVLPYVQQAATAITAKSKNPDVAARFLDYGYSNEGGMLMNFGIEGESYTMVNNEPTYTSLITKNPNGRSMSENMGMYLLSSTSGPFIQDKRYITQYYALQQQKDALVKWSNVDQEKYTLPQITLTNEETAKFSPIIATITTLKSETFMNIILGKVPVDSGFEEFLKKAKDVKIDEAIKIQQDAYARYQKRK